MRGARNHRVLFHGDELRQRSAHDRPRRHRRRRAVRGRRLRHPARRGLRVAAAQLRAVQRLRSAAGRASVHAERHTRLQRVAPRAFLAKRLRGRRRVAPRRYRRVHVWSTTDLGAFWSRVWDYCGITGHKGNGPYFVPPSAHAPPSDARFFPAASACLAENLLRYARTEPGRVALIACSEQSGDGTSALTQPPRWRATLRRGCQAARAGGGQG